MSIKKDLKNPTTSQRFEAEVRYSTPHDGHVSETLKALHRLGDNSRKAMAWLVDFAQQDLTKLSEGDRLNLQYEIKTFSAFDPSRNRKDFDKSSVPIVYTDPAMNEDPFLIGKHLPELAEIIKIQEFVAQTFKDINEKSLVLFRIPHMELGVYKQQTSKGVTGGIVVSAANIETAFYYSFARLLASYVGQLRLCLECKKFFLADRKNQFYCTPRCQTRVATRKFRNTPSERIGKQGRPPKLDSPSSNKVQNKHNKDREIFKNKPSPTKEKNHGTKTRTR